eukprot:CAMPEP_0183367144 /NCGR_PEP_ID=MMETSP0164_2-20130417/91464_1 /TAXON_ID=221442 /ORGANISM="Coccolithus pelagicus ssp braarudi, Strain PLY182g" /LENGTH=113 /DNA_ID=CAMNT_0025543039 /DNA_START=132 /DNA_END=470 /DNA_ORIENTATION=+
MEDPIVSIMATLALASNPATYAMSNAACDLGLRQAQQPAGWLPHQHVLLPDPIGRRSQRAGVDRALRRRRMALDSLRGPLALARAGPLVYVELPLDLRESDDKHARVPLRSLA